MSKKPIPRKPAAAKKSTAISLRIDERLKQHVARMAEDECTTPSEWITALIRENARSAARTVGTSLQDYLNDLME